MDTSLRDIFGFNSRGASKPLHKHQLMHHALAHWLACFQYGMQQRSAVLASTRACAEPRAERSAGGRRHGICLLLIYHAAVSVIGNGVRVNARETVSFGLVLTRI